MAYYQKVVKMLGENLASFLELAKKLLVDWGVDPKQLLHLLHNISKEEFVGLINKTHEIKAKPVIEPALVFIVRVDRTVRPTYPKWMDKLIHSDLELTGPAEYYLNTLGLWLHNDQKNGIVTGNTIYAQLKKDNAIADCLGLADLLAIQAKGIDVFRKLYLGKAVFGWKSVVQDQDGVLNVPYLVEFSGKVVLYWFWLDNRWNSNDPTLRFSK
jgi:hypothetical protein